MKLREWKYMNPQNSNTTSAASTSAKPSGGSTKRFQKLLDYHIAHKDKDVDNIIQKDINPYGFTYVEHHANGSGGYIRKVKALMNARGDWTFSVFINEKEIVLKKGNGWETFVHDISFDLNLPIFTTDPDYQDLLEWVDKSGKKVSLNNSSSSSASGSSSTSSGYKKRFEKLIKYHTDHASSELESITRKDIKDYSFRLGEHYNDGHDEFDRDILVAYDSSSDTFFIHIFVDRKEVESMQCDSYENFVKAIEPYMFLPDSGTQEYDDLLEWVDSTGKKVNINTSSQPASKTSSNNSTSASNNGPGQVDQIYRYKKLIAQIDADKICTYKVNKLDDTTLDITVTTKYKKDLRTKITYNPATDDYSLEVGANKPIQGMDYERDILEIFVVAAIINSTDLCEATSFAKEFKLYEDLWTENN